MQQPQETALNIEPDPGTEAEADVRELVRRLAGAIDGAVIPQQDTRAAIAEALLRLALGVQVFANGAETTRQRLLALALRTGSASETVH